MDKETRDAEFEEVEELGQSPVPGASAKKVEVKSTMDFYGAVKAMTKEQKVARLDWRDKQFWGELKDAVLKLHKPDGKYYDWIINDGDIEGDDWIIID